jgi:hypothetical protein
VKNRNKRGINMKLIIVLFASICLNTLFAQEIETTIPFTHYNFGFYGGINSGINSETGTSFFVESKTNLISNLYLNLTLGYSKVFEHESFTEKSNDSFNFNGTIIYYGNRKDINERGYDIIPISLGCQYVFKNQTISPYLLFDLNYDVILNTRDYISYAITYQYPSYDAIPDEYKANQDIPSSTNYSYGILLGVGGICKISSKLNLDIRYFYKYDSKIVNSNQLVIGIYF